METKKAILIMLVGMTILGFAVSSVSAAYCKVQVTGHEVKWQGGGVSECYVADESFPWGDAYAYAYASAYNANPPVDEDSDSGYCREAQASAYGKNFDTTDAYADVWGCL